MNAKKIMGAVLVALLAAALFVGAGAAIDDAGTVFVYQESNNISGSYTFGANTITAIQNGTNGYYFAGSNIIEGTYKNATHQITVKYPTASINGLAETQSGKQYIVDGGILYSDSKVNFTISNAALTGTPYTQVLVTYPNGSVISNFGSQLSGNQISLGFGDTTTTKLPTGKYQLQPVFDDQSFVPGTPAGLLASKAVYVFTVADSADATISASVDSVLEKSVINVVVTGKPGETYNVTGSKFIDFTMDGTSLVNDQFTMPNDGKATIQAKAESSGTGKITVENNGKKVSLSVKIEAGTITAATEKDSYYVGDNVVLSGTSTAGSPLYFYIAGTNIKLQYLDVTASVNNGAWEKEITKDQLKLKTGVTTENLDAGTYTIYVSNNLTNAIPADLEDLDTYATAALILKQPFISDVNAPAVAVKGTIYKVTGIADATTELSVYVFGTNFFAAANGTKNVVGTDIFKGTGNGVSFDDEKTNEFTLELDIPKENMAGGQYFLVIQHPMYDGEFNIWANGSDIVTAPTVNNVVDKDNGTILFNVYDRQTTNAAQALCDALDTQNIDDMYVKLSFVVAAPSSVINPIPAEITKGSKLTVSGTTNMGEGELVTVEMLATAFAAVPKETVGSASFIALTTKTDENGNWEVTFDTKDLNAGEYSVSVSVASIDGESAKINVIEGAPTEQPTTTPTQEQPTEQPTQTEAPKTPGFGALAALAGLGAVAVLLLRRE